MEQNEIVLRAIGILTESKNMYDVFNEDPDADYEMNGAIGTLINESFPSVTIPGDATPQEAGAAVAKAAVMTTIRLVSAFAFLFSELADAHDAGRSDVTTADLLRELALRFSNPAAENEA